MASSPNGSSKALKHLLEGIRVLELANELVSYPVIVGQGTRLFPDPGPDRALELVTFRTALRGITNPDLSASRAPGVRNVHGRPEHVDLTAPRSRIASRRTCKSRPSLIAEQYLGPNQGVGFLIANATSFVQATTVFAGLIVLMLMVAAIDFVLRAVERQVLQAWKQG